MVSHLEKEIFYRRNYSVIIINRSWCNSIRCLRSRRSGIPHRGTGLPEDSWKFRCKGSQETTPLQGLSLRGRGVTLLCINEFYRIMG